MIRARGRAPWDNGRTTRRTQGHGLAQHKILTRVPSHEIVNSDLVVEVRADDGSLLILDAGTGLRALGATLGRDAIRIDILLSHLHLGHLQGLGFFAPLYDRRGEVHLWGPPSPAGSLRARLGRYLSPPLFPVRLRDLGPQIVLHELPPEPHSIGPFRIRSAFVIHPGPTVGYRIVECAGGRPGNRFCSTDGRRLIPQRTAHSPH